MALMKMPTYAGGGGEQYFEILTEDKSLSASNTTTVTCGFEPKRIEVWTYNVSGAGNQVYRTHQFYDNVMDADYVYYSVYNNSTNAGYGSPARNSKSMSTGISGEISGITSTGFTLSKNQYSANYCMGYKCRVWG